jgi:hypothetical protein
MNKKIWILILSLIMLFVTACGIDIKQKEKTLYETIEKEMYESDDDDIDQLIKQYNEMAKSDNEPYTLVKFIDENIKNVAEKEAVIMVLILEEVQKEYTQRYADDLFADNNQSELLNLSAGELFFDESKIEEIRNADLKKLVKKIIDGKYKLVNIGGAFYPAIDYVKLKESYSNYLPDEIKDYLEIKSQSSNVPKVIDGEMTVSYEELAQRLIAIENYVSKYPNGVKLQDVLRCYGECLKLYLEGSTNSPIFDVETGKIKDEVMSSYIKLSSTKKLMTSKIISKYIEIIQKNENTIDENVLSHVPEIYSNAIAALENIK